MISLQIKEVKAFMAKLLTLPTFDFFQTTEVIITTYNTFIIDGHTNKDFYSSKEKAADLEQVSEFSSWSQLRPICFELMKGKKTPLSFKIILQLPRQDVLAFCSSSITDLTDETLKACVLTLKFDGSQLFCITGTSHTTFSMDKTSDSIWDKKIIQYFTSESINFDLLT